MRPARRLSQYAGGDGPGRAGAAAPVLGAIKVVHVGDSIFTEFDLLAAIRLLLLEGLHILLRLRLSERKDSTAIAYSRLQKGTYA